MKKLVSMFVLSMVVFGVNAAENGRPAMTNKIMNAPSSQRYTASVNQLNTVSLGTPNNTVTPTPTVTAPTQPVEPEKDMREAERNACINNNIGIGNALPCPLPVGTGKQQYRYRKYFCLGFPL